MSKFGEHNNTLIPLPYMKDIACFLKENESELWEWFSSHKVKKEYTDSIQLDLLKSTYRLDRENHKDLYDLACEIMEVLSLENPITFYQGQDLTVGMNASLAYIPGETHIIFQGPILSCLNKLEIKAVIAHELTHFMLWEKWDNQYMTTSQILAAMTHDRQAEPAHLESGRLFDLYCEIFCDRGSLYITNDLNATISTHVKLKTGLKEVCPESYMRQSEEIFSKGITKTNGLSHPESFIRTRALKLWHDESPDYNCQIARMIEGKPSLNELDLLAQRKVMNLTRNLIELFLSTKWIQTEAVVAHGRLFFDDFTPIETSINIAEMVESIEFCDDHLKDYYCYVLLDFVAADPDLEDAPLAAAIVLPRTLGIYEQFAKIAAKELNLNKKQFEKIEQNADKLLKELDKEEERG